MFINAFGSMNFVAGLAVGAVIGWKRDADDNFRNENE
jgi:F0F1-type ATP synthase assembly protein I